MPHVLHLLRDAAHPVALDVIAAQARRADTRVSVVLLAGAGEPAAPLPGRVYRLGAPSGGAPGQAIDHDGLLDLVFRADSVVTW